MIIILFNKSHVDFINTYFLQCEHLGSRRDTLKCKYQVSGHIDYLFCFAMAIMPAVVLLITANPKLKPRLQYLHCIPNIYSHLHQAKWEGTVAVSKDNEIYCLIHRSIVHLLINIHVEHFKLGAEPLATCKWNYQQSL